MEKKYRKIWIGIFAILIMGALFLWIVLTVPSFLKKTQDRTAESEEQIEEKKPEQIYGMRTEELLQQTDQLQRCNDQTVDCWKESEEEFWVLDEIPKKEIFLYGIQTDGKTQLALRTGDDIYPIEDIDWGYYDTMEILSDGTVIDDKTVIFLEAYKRRVRRDLYIVEMTEGSTQTYPFIQKGEIYSKAEQMAEMMGYRKPEPNPGDEFYAHDAVVWLKINLWLEEEEDPDPYGQYNIDMEYIGNGIFHIGDYILEEAAPKG